MVTYVPGESSYSQHKETSAYKMAERAYMRGREQYARNQQRAAQEKIIADHNRELSELSSMMGQAVNDPAKKAQVVAMYQAADERYKTAMQSTRDLSQYYEGYKGADAENGNKPAENGNKPAENGNKPAENGNKPAENGKTAQYAGLADYFYGKMANGKIQAPNVEHLQRQAEMHDRQAGDEQKNAQQNFRVANRDYRVEAEKNAVSQAAAENAQKVHNLGNASAGAAALERDVKTADYNTYMQRQDQQRAEGVKNQREMWGSRQTAEEERGAIGKENHDYLDMYASNNRSNALSEGGNPDGEGTAGSDGKGNSNSTEPKEQPPDEAETSDDGDGNLHVVLNYIEGSQKDADKYTTPSIQTLIKKYGVKPLPPERQTFDRSADYLVKCLYPKFIEDYNAATGRNVGDPNQVDAQTKADIDEYVQKSNVQLQDQQEAQQNVNTALGSIRY